MTTETTETTEAPQQAPVPQASLLASAAPSDDDYSWVPEKYRVTKEGNVDLAESLRKTVDAHKSLEQKLGKNGHAPKAPEEYAPEIPEGIKWDDWKSDPKMQGFLKGAHARGITNEQMSYILGQYTEEAKALMVAKREQETAGIEAALRSHWKDDGQFHTNLRLANRAVDTAIAHMDPEIGAIVRKAADEGKLDGEASLLLLQFWGASIAEDTPLSGAISPAVDDTKRIAEIDDELKKMSPWDNRKNALLEEKMALYTKRYPKAS